MTRVRWSLVGAVLVVHAASAGVLAAVSEPSASPPEQSGEINVNPYGDPIWQSGPDRARPKHSVKRSRAKSHPNAKRLHAKLKPQFKPQLHAKLKPHPHAARIRARPHGYATATPSKPRHAKPPAVGRPLNIVPPAARAP